MKFWISWFHKKEFSPFELHTPWWVSGYDGDGSETVCAALIADDDEKAREMIYACYDVRPDVIEWRFCHSKEEDWSPFCDRFPRAGWMKWHGKV